MTDAFLNPQVYDVTTEQQVSCMQLPLSPRSTLSWLGFSREGVPAAYDSQGVLRVQGQGFGNAWVPVFDAAKERKGNEHFWIVGLDMGHLHCVVCPAQTPYPMVCKSHGVDQFLVVCMASLTLLGG